MEKQPSQALAEPLVPGALVEVAVTNAADKRMVRVSMDSQAVRGTTAQEGSWTTIGTILFYNSFC